MQKDVFTRIRGKSNQTEVSQSKNNLNTLLPVINCLLKHGSAEWTFGEHLVIWAMKNNKSAYPLQQLSVLLTKSTMVLMFLFFFFGHITTVFDDTSLYHGSATKLFFVKI